MKSQATFIHVVLCAFYFSLGISSAPAEAQSGTLVIRGGTMVDVRSGRLLEDSVVFIRAGRIAGIAKEGDLEIPLDAQVIEAHGKYLIPGLIDMHHHYRDWVPELVVNHGVTTVRDTGSEFTWITSMKRAQEAGLLDREGVDWYSRPGPRIIVAAVMNTWPNGAGHHYQAKTVEDARQAVEWMLANGASSFKMHSGTSLEMIRAVSEEAHRRGVRVSAHLAKTIPIREGILAGLDGVEHAADLLDHPESESMELVRLMVTRGVYWTPTVKCYSMEEMGNPEGASAEDSAYVQHLFSDPGLRYLPAVFRKNQTEFYYPAGGRKPLETGEEARKYRYWMKLIKAYVNGGGNLLAGSDSGAFGLSGFLLHQELAEFVSGAGLTPLQALQAATLRAAEYLGRTDLGEIAVGARADIVLLEANPLADIRNTRKISAVIQDGKLRPLVYHEKFAQLLPRPTLPKSFEIGGAELVAKPVVR